MKMLFVVVCLLVAACTPDERTERMALDLIDCYVAGYGGAIVAFPEMPMIDGYEYTQHTQVYMVNCIGPQMIEAE